MMEGVYQYCGNAIVIRKQLTDGSFEYAFHDIPSVGKIGLVFSEELFAERVAVKFPDFHVHTVHDSSELAAVFRAYTQQGAGFISYDSAPGKKADYATIVNAAKAFGV